MKKENNMFVTPANVPEFLPNTTIGQFSDGRTTEVNDRKFAPFLTSYVLPDGQRTTNLRSCVDIWKNCAETFLNILGLAEYTLHSCNPSFKFFKGNCNNIFVIDAEVVLDTLAAFEVYKV